MYISRYTTEMKTLVVIIAVFSVLMILLMPTVARAKPLGDSGTTRGSVTPDRGTGFIMPGILFAETGSSEEVVEKQKKSMLTKQDTRREIRILKRQIRELQREIKRLERTL